VYYILGSLGAVLKCATTGGAAHNIGGITWQSAMGKSSASSVLKMNDVISATAMQKLQAKFDGCELVIIDEVSMASLQDLYEWHRRLSAAKNCHDKPFGGVHIVFSFDFYQMRNVSGTSITESDIHPKKTEALYARRLWVERMTDYCLLTQNMRAANTDGSVSKLAKLSAKLRLGIANTDDLLPLNQLVVNVSTAMCISHPNAIWITSTHDKIAEINLKYIKKLAQDGEQVIRLITKHVPAVIGIPQPDPVKRQLL
jgi:hypothetical protein